MNFYTIFYKILFKFQNIKYGKNLKIHGRIFLENKKNFSLLIGDNVEIYPWVHFKFYENTQIIIEDNVKLDSFSRFVVANSSKIRIGNNSKIGKSTIINAGADVLIGRKNLIAQNCSINSSAHNYKGDLDILDLGFNHEQVILKDNIWLGANVIINPGTIIEEHSVIGAGCNIKGKIENYSLVKNDTKTILKKILKKSNENK